MLEFEEMYAQSGRMVETNGTSRYCSLNVELDYPSLEWSFAVQTVEYFGYISIPTNVNATLSSSTYFGPTAKSTAFVEFVGPMKKLFENSASFGEDLVWSECGETAQAAGIQTGIEIKGDGKKDALVTVDFDSGRMRQLYAIQWRRCVL